MKIQCTKERRFLARKHIYRGRANDFLILFGARTLLSIHEWKTFQIRFVKKKKKNLEKRIIILRVLLPFNKILYRKNVQNNEKEILLLENIAFHFNRMSFQSNIIMRFSSTFFYLIWFDFYRIQSNGIIAFGALMVHAPTKYFSIFFSVRISSLLIRVLKTCWIKWIFFFFCIQNFWKSNSIKRYRTQKKNAISFSDSWSDNSKWIRTACGWKFLGIMLVTLSFLS